MRKKIVEKETTTADPPPARPLSPFEDTLKRLLRVKKSELDEALEREKRAKGRPGKR